jgi:recombination protein RecR
MAKGEGLVLPAGLPVAVGRLGSAFARLPGVGDKTAVRFAIHLATLGSGANGAAEQLLAALEALRGVRLCEDCGGLAEGEQAVCAICADIKRDDGVLCVVARVQDVFAMERSGAYRGRYFVLGRLVSPLEGIGAEDLPLPLLRARVDLLRPAEVLLALPQSVEGEATGMVVARELRAEGRRVTQLASGLAHGAELEYADVVTLKRALDARRDVT